MYLSIILPNGNPIKIPIIESHKFCFTNIFLIDTGLYSENLKEKVHISIGMIDNLCHEIVYHKHSELNYEKMIDIVVSTISCMLL